MEERLAGRPRRRWKMYYLRCDVNDGIDLAQVPVNPE
jgi:hypothetical protein